MGTADGTDGQQIGEADALVSEAAYDDSKANHQVEFEWRVSPPLS